jgi:hypothetical protein
MHKNKRVELGFKQRKNVCKFKYDTNKIIWTNRVKGKNCMLGWMAAQGRKLRKENRQQYTKNMSKKRNVFKIECCGSYHQLPTERTKQKFVDF